MLTENGLEKEPAGGEKLRDETVCRDGVLLQAVLLLSWIHADIPQD